MGAVTFWRSAQEPPTPDAPSPERQALAEAIKAKHADDERLAALRKAHQDAERRLFRQRDAVEAATAALAKSKQDQAAHLVAQASGRSEPAPVTIRAARVALTDAEDEVTACEAARATLKEQLDDAAQRPDSAATRVRRAALDVIRVEGAAAAHALVADVERLQGELIRRGAALEWLATEPQTFELSERIGIDYREVVDLRIRATLDRVRRLPRVWSDLGPDQTAGRQAWVDALAALEADASAALPGT